ncbi:hypothetical protein L6452_36253 [Arctium lappa]|uniref:Uncharacterized protein n=1 Tax=Arctium lappa TaxID=4217 RepID=A0ACB8YA63_ARCLA|nr:hypothetical protein L6452_36253 [Arctium lappa]
MKHQGHPRRTEELHIKGVLALGLALMMGRLVVLRPFCDRVHGCHESIGIEYGIFSTCYKQAFCNCCRNGAIQNDIQGQQRALNYLLRSVGTLDPPMREAYIRAAREQLESLERRQQALRAEHQALIVQAVIHGHRGD